MKKYMTKFMIHLMLLISLFLGLSTSMALSSDIDNKNSCVVIMHGLARTSNSMKKMAKNLEASGFSVWNQTYPSTEKKIENLSPIINRALEFCVIEGTEQIFFVTHSMGGILVRHYFQSDNLQNEQPNILKAKKLVKGIVMISPPNHGSEIVDAFKSKAWFKWYNGPAGLQLGTDTKSFPNTLSPIDIPVGIITGNVSSDPWFSYLFKGPNDGKVSVESAKLKEMKDFLVVPNGHTFIMNADEVIQQTMYFLKNSKFEKIK